MATYPIELIQLDGTEVRPQSGKAMRQSASGKFRIRNYYSEPRSIVVIKHFLSAAELATLDAFYDTYSDATFTFVYQADGASYSCLFADIPRSLPKGGGYFEVTVSAVVV